MDRGRPLARSSAVARLITLDSHVRPPNFRRNLDTELFQGFNPSGSTDLRQAYGFARGLAKMQPGGAPIVPGHRLVWVRGGAFASTTLSAADDAFAIVGRHTQCGIPLMDDPFVALRHLLVRSIKLPSGGVALRILDLQTNLGFVLPDGSRHTSIFAEGPIAVAVGEYALVALPNETKEDDLPGELPKPEMHTPPAVREQLAALGQAMSPYRQNARPNRVSRITLMPRPVMIGEALPPSLSRLTGGAGWSLTLQREGRSATVTLSDEDLLRGAMVGRSEKCCSEMLRRITDVNTSRAHVLILRDGPIVYAYDLASTQGTYLHGMPARRAVLSDGGTMLTLGRGENAVRLLWQRSA
jgi:hypothetical protein